MWLSLVERFVRDEEVACSNPVTPTIPEALETELFLFCLSLIMIIKLLFRLRQL